jgi:16S rRNA (cytosine1402-N4)-methyltransferase
LTQWPHQPVMLEEVCEHLKAVPGGRYIDGTVGLGGHTEAVLSRFPDSHVLGVDRDRDALAQAGQRLAGFGDRVVLVQGSYSEMERHATQVGWDRVDGILLDIGISSMQLDTAGRGFSHRLDGPLDMRMDRRGPVTAATIVNTWTEDQLTDVFRRYGEERRARQVARAVVAEREERPFARTAELAELLQRVVGQRRGPTLPPATRCFQALRIAVNRELAELEAGLVSALKLLRPGGRLVVISFHSLEDRIAKHFFRHEAAICVCPPGLPICVCGKKATLQILTRKPLRPSAEELDMNRRAGSAKLRAVERLADDAT